MTFCAVLLNAVPALQDAQATTCLVPYALSGTALYASLTGHIGSPLCIGIKMDLGLVPNYLQAVIKAHGFKLVHPDTIVVWPMS